MKVMPGVLGQVGQSVANNLFEVGQGVVKGTAGAMADIASGSIEQLTATPVSAAPMVRENKPPEAMSPADARKAAEKKRFNEVRAELAQYVQRRAEMDQKIAEEQQAKQEEFVQKKKKESWLNKIINRSQTTTEKGRLQE